ncbi:hypothetical protein PTSG_12994 [Salpingoeca rosetta]|uniref:Small EDRK-rich factor-like N-terminal domain-containing protein n=1 Tax=Salpingoeca rosetta (strain ATCC 50818 / BSB-021) TaxID=946362 RepID=F2UPI5_SALR5|nr:uncharacterized protein PTSG_12994 [Salpingoeca rosetta]EGD79540.1 hypothetical protein PTSG_12994 [Salpingoeca rosetta]|eukprot:XP_004989021.1 hypothetical protein PTSG_12994 [Salpingoeca rosetta]
MSRGLAKQQAKEKAAKKNQKLKGSSKHDHKAARAAQLKLVCSVCRAPMSDKSVYKSHFQAKHPKAPTPPELQ